MKSCPLLALSRHLQLQSTCPLSELKQTWRFARIRFRGRYWEQNDMPFCTCICLLVAQSGHGNAFQKTPLPMFEC